PDDAGAVVRRSGGTVLASYDTLGVTVVQSSDGDFPSDMLSDQRVEGISATRSLQQPLVSEPNATQLTRAAANDSDPLVQLAVVPYTGVDMNQSGPVAILGGSVDLSDSLIAPWIDHAVSVDCSSGAPNSGINSWSNAHGSGTAAAEYMASRLAAVEPPGAAPRPEIAVVRVTNGQGEVAPEALICGLSWAAAHHLSMAIIGDSSSPILLECQDATNERTAWFAEQRALAYAEQERVQLVQVKGAAPELAPSPNATPDNQCAILSGGPSAEPISTTTP
ncbi:MAG TPA: hypothetical protein VKU87_02115, partial [Thermomicrobiaceae bacterium]|nr:hypothetical protein [Thermomicrobiaceae bacterium]